jgi:hypothetical protein
MITGRATADIHPIGLQAHETRDRKSAAGTSGKLARRMSATPGDIREHAQRRTCGLHARERLVLTGSSGREFQW